MLVRVKVMVVVGEDKQTNKHFLPLFFSLFFSFYFFFDATDKEEEGNFYRVLAGVSFRWFC